MELKDTKRALHIFVKIYKELLEGYPECDTPERAEKVEAIFREAAKLEIEWGRDVIGDKIDLDIEDVKDYIYFYANVRCAQLSYERPFEEYRI